MDFKKILIKLRKVIAVLFSLGYDKHLDYDQDIVSKDGFKKRELKTNNVGILAYGSLITDPGIEIKSNIASVKNVRTPFKVEFARKSNTRNNAPTLIPVKEGGDNVEAKLFVLEEEVSRKEAKDMLYRRETHKICSKEEYCPSTKATPNKVFIKEIEDLHDIKIVLYTEIGKNIDNPTPKKLAELAIESARSRAGREKKDGISYLIDAKYTGIKTPLMPEYEKEILKQTKTKSLHEAILKIQGKISCK